MLRIQKTSDYSLFRFYMQTNREVCNSAIKALQASVQSKNMLESHPILVDKEMRIIDGQHRLEVAKRLNVPIYYVVDETVEEYDIPRCQIQKKWEIKDYLKYYSVVQDDYAFVKDIYENYGLSGHLPFVVQSCGSIASATDAFRKGIFKITKDKSKLREKFTYMKEIKQQIKKNKENVYFSAESLKALWKLISYPNYKHKIMIEKIDKYIDNAVSALNFKKKDNILETFIDKVYNYMNKKAEKLVQE